MIDKKAGAQLPFVPGLCACRFFIRLPLQLWHRYSRTGVIFKFTHQSRSFVSRSASPVRQNRIPHGCRSAIRR